MLLGIIVSSALVMGAGIGVAYWARSMVDNSIHNQCAISLGRNTPLPPGTDTSLSIIRAAVAGLSQAQRNAITIPLGATISSNATWVTTTMRTALANALNAIGYDAATAAQLSRNPMLICLPPSITVDQASAILFALPLPQRRVQLARAAASVEAVLNGWWDGPGQSSAPPTPDDRNTTIANTKQAILNVLATPGAAGIA
jgi:hypothetical protein